MKQTIRMLIEIRAPNVPAIEVSHVWLKSLGPSFAERHSVGFGSSAPAAYTHLTSLLMTQKWLPHLPSGTHNDGRSVTERPCSVSFQLGCREPIRLTSICWPQPHGQASTAHFGLP